MRIPKSQEKAKRWTRSVWGSASDIYHPGRLTVQLKYPLVDADVDGINRVRQAREKNGDRDAEQCQCH
jgi:hypothetical protein